MAKPMPYGIKEPAAIPDVADKVLAVYFRVVNKLEIPSCLAYGLCLGFVRDGGYIRGDNDLDVIAFTRTNGLLPTLSEALIKRGFKRGTVFPPPYNNVHFHRDKVLLDIYFRKPEKFYALFDYVMYKNKAYPVPYPVEDYLEDFYGNWRVLDRK